MAEISYPVADGGSVTEFAYENLMGQALGEGRYDPESVGINSSPIVYADSTGRQVKLRAGTAALLRGFRWEAGADPVVVPLAANTTGQPRVDLIVLRLDRASYTVRAVAIAGAPSATPATPAPVRSITSTGFYDLPIASVRVVSNATTGLPSIAAADVTALEVRIGPQPRVGTSAVMRNTAHPIGTVWTEFDARKVVANAGAGPMLLGEEGVRTKLGMSIGWGNDIIYVIRKNGWTMLEGSATWTDATARQPSVLTNITTLPDAFRPITSLNSICMISPTQLARFYIDAATGIVTLRQYAVALSTGGGIVIPPTTYPSKGV